VYFAAEMMQKIKGAKSKAAHSATVIGAAAAHGAAHGASKVGGTVVHATEAVGHKVMDGVEKGAHLAVDSVEKGAHLAVDSVEKGAHLAVDGVEFGGHLAVQGAGVTIHALSNPSETAHKAAEAGGVVVDAIEHKVVNTTRFIGDSEYREKEVLPYIKESLHAASVGIQQELHESDEMVHLLWRWGEGDKTLTEAEKQQCVDQMADLAKVVPVLGIFLLPGGAVLLPLAAQLLPFDLFPSAFSSPEPEPEPEPELEPEPAVATLGPTPEGTGPKPGRREDDAELRRGSTLVGTTTAGNMGDDEDMPED
jgi:hypothetical protein